MTSPRWVPTGDNWMWATWVGDAQVIYLVKKDTTLSATQPDYQVIKKVSGAANPHGYIIGANHDPNKAKWWAEHDAGQPL